MNKTIDIIVLAYNGGTDLTECVASLYEHTPLAATVRLHVVDNASSDGSLAALEQRWPTLHIIKNSDNLGFTGGNNVGLRWALAHETEYVVLLNQDLVVEAGWLEALVATADSDDRIGLVQSLLVLKKNPAAINSWGCDIHILGFGVVGGYRTLVAQAGARVTGTPDIPYAMFAAVLIKRAVLEAVGLFDEKTFMYHDDMDICLRARLLGWRLVLAPTSKVHHDYKETMSERTYYGLEVNRLWNPLKFYRWPTLVILFPLWFIFEIAGVVYALKQGYAKSWWRARWYTFKHLPHIWQWRQKIQQSRRISDRTLLAVARASLPRVRATTILENIVRLPLSWLAVFYWAIVRQIIFW